MNLSLRPSADDGDQGRGLRLQVDAVAGRGPGLGRVVRAVGAESWYFVDLPEA